MQVNSRLRLLITCLMVFLLGGNSNQEATAQVSNAVQKPTAKLVQKNNDKKAVKKNDKANANATVSPLISADDLKKLIESDIAGVKILEPARDTVDYLKGHVPGAQYLNWVDDMTDLENVERYNNPNGEEFAKVMSRLGIKNDDRIIIYDRLDNRLSTRLFWTLKCFDHQRVQVLDGGFRAWESKAHELSKDTPKVAQSEYSVSDVQEKLIAEMAFVESQRKDPNTRLVDGRPPQQFTGEQPGKVFHTGEAHPRKGHIPGAINVFWVDNFNVDGTFKSAAELRALYSNANVKPGNEVITYCNEGLHAAPPWFVLTQLLEYEDVRVYDSSMAEWAKSKLPMKTMKADK